MSERRPRSPAPSTEAVHDRTADLDRRSTREILETIHAEDLQAVRAVGAVLAQAERAVGVLTDVLARGGRWFNVGAGTSGRLGCADAAELPPTFGIPPEWVIGVIAGGPSALARAQEGAEDDSEAARRILGEHGLRAGDAVLALSASGRTPFALGGLALAREVGARRLAITCDPASPLAEAAEIVMAPAVGPEVIAGSTRMKGGLVEKMLLHLLSTTVMVRLGRVVGNRMAELRPASEKLRRRAVEIVRDLARVDEEAAGRLLAESGGSVRGALEAARRAASEPIPPPGRPRSE